MNRNFKLTLLSKMSYGELQSCSINLRMRLFIIYFVGIARTTEMLNRRTVVKMRQNKGFIKLH